jgi:hypothetical protein
MVIEAGYLEARRMSVIGIFHQLSRAGRILKSPKRNRAGQNSRGLLISSCRSVRDDGFGGCLKFIAHPP